MKYGTKQVSSDSNWLDDISGLKVYQAIEYLKALKQDVYLNYYMEGDTHGCDVYSSLIEDIPLTFIEFKNYLLVRANKELKRLNDAKEYYQSDFQLCSENLKPKRIEQIKNLDIKIETQLTKIESIKLRTE